MSECHTRGCEATVHRRISLVARPVFDPVLATTYDWVHTFLQGGVFIVEVEALMHDARIDRRVLQTFLKDTAWLFPWSCKHKMSDVHRVFSEHRQSSTDAGKVKCSCSEALSLYGLLRLHSPLQSPPLVHPRRSPTRFGNLSFASPLVSQRCRPPARLSDSSLGVAIVDVRGFGAVCKQVMARRVRVVSGRGARVAGT